MPRYVILEHDWPSRHWDLMLQAGEVLRTWRLDALPSEGRQVGAEAVFDHRPVYLDYEGPISGGRGTVIRHDAGTFSWIEDTPDVLRLDTSGRVLNGVLELTRDAVAGWVVTYRPEATESGPGRVLRDRPAT